MMTIIRRNQGRERNSDSMEFDNNQYKRLLSRRNNESMKYDHSQYQGLLGERCGGSMGHDDNQLLRRMNH
jgi:hypothetical protein